MKISITIIFSLISLLVKADNLSSPQIIEYSDTSKPFIKEINSVPFYELIVNFQKQLSLDSIANGSEGLQIRIWASTMASISLICITELNSKWNASYYDIQIGPTSATDFNYKIVKQKMKAVFPKSGWPIFSQKLLESQILTFPDASKLPRGAAVSDGTIYFIEVATKDQFRFYVSSNPRIQQKWTKEFKYLVEILDYVNSELDTYFLERD